MLTENDIAAAYVFLLGRQPDPSGIAHYRQLGAAGMSVEGLRTDLMQSHEFTQFFEPGQRVVNMGYAKVVVDASEIEFGRSIAKDKTWEPHVVEILRSSLKPTDTFVDVGANVGIMSFTAASILTEGRVLAFEPHPENIRNFLAGVEENKFGNVTLYGFGLSSQTSVFSIFGSSNGYLMPGGQTTFQATALRGDDVLERAGPISFIKMDIEGHEPHAIKGLDHTLRANKPGMLVEFNPRCLKAHIGCPPDEFAEQIFTYTDKITAVEHSGARNEIRSAKDLISLWNRKNQEAVEANFLPDGVLHFDLLFKVR